MLAEDKKELIRAVARNAGGGSKYDSESDDEDDDDEIGLDVVANKGAASIFLLSGPPGESLKFVTMPSFELILTKKYHCIYSTFLLSYRLW